MSGPYRCLVCGGHGSVEAGFDGDRTERCTTCHGTGERWLEMVFCPSQDDRDLGRVEYVGGKWRFKDRTRGAERSTPATEKGGVAGQLGPARAKREAG